MKEKASPRKIVFFISLIFLLMAAFSVSGYYYLMNRFSVQIVEAVETVMDGFTPEELDALVNDEELRVLLEQWQAKKGDGSSSENGLSIDADDIAGLIGDNDAEDASVGGDTEAASGSTNPADNNGGDSGFGGGNSNGNSNSGSNGTVVDGSGGSGSGSSPESSPSTGNPVDEDKNNNGGNQGVTVPGLDSSLAHKISANDTVFLLRVYRRFSASEREELMSLYREGGNGSVIKERVESRLSGEELERVVGIALKIVD